MKAWRVTQLGEPEQVMELQECDLPDPGPGEIQIAVQVAGIGLPDALMCKGQYAFKPEIPFSPGQEMCGRVHAVGEGVSHQPGDRLMGVSAFYAGQGGFAEQCMTHTDMVFPVPQTMGDSDAACFVIPYHTAWLGLVDRAGLLAGETLVVLGAAGGSGCAAVELGVALGARVLAVAGSDDKLELCRQMGATEVINHRLEEVAARILDLTDGRGADVIYDPVGGDFAGGLVRSLASHGRLLAIGFASGSWVNADAGDLTMRNASVLGVYVGAYTPEQRRGAQHELAVLFNQGLIKPVPCDVVDFAQLPAAVGRVSRGDVVGKLAVKISG